MISRVTSFSVGDTDAKPVDKIIDEPMNENVVVQFDAGSFL